MNLVKTTMALTIAATFTAPVMASDEINFYGKANVGLQYSDEGGESQTEVKSNASRLGVTGDLKVNDSLSVVYKAEVQIEMADDSDDTDNIKGRNQYIGLKGNFGTVLLGRNDTMLKQSQGKIDLFSDYEGDIKNLWKGENRMGESVSYVSPKFGDFSAGVTYVAEGDDDQGGEAGISTAVFYGDSGLKKSNWFASVALDSEVDGEDAMRFNVATKLGAFKLGFIAHSQEVVATGEETTGFMFSAAYKLNKDFTLKGQVQTAEEDFGDKAEKTAFTAGVDYALAKNAKLYAFYTAFDLDEDVTGDEDQSYLSTGIEYKF
ncbi:porin [Thalassotalea psychrophila]|uniref:Porin n=1 Tax=Thalassotalea psychrophila TaxID=3065647 RepID=A0ABY9TYJ5_9GAMM|nr:porin [Colwelliaceae bacterium SQ149]